MLIGSQSFWEGVDVRGDALSVVIIDKLPFAPPDDPVLAARIEVMEKKGLNGFMHHQLPEAIINLKQGAGRLIRDETDRGVLMICDPRLISKALWQAHLAKPAAVQAHARNRHGAGVPAAPGLSTTSVPPIRNCGVCCKNGHFIKRDGGAIYIWSM